MSRLFLVVMVLLLASLGCRDPTLVPPRSLESPSAMAVARGDVCLVTFDDADRVQRFEFKPCEDGERGAIGLITNEQSDRLAFMDLNSSLPRLVDFDAGTPGPNHLVVGRLPVDVAVSPDGTVAYTLNQLDRDVSIVDLYTPEVLTSRFSVDETPIAMDVDPVSGEVVVAAGSPTRLYGFAGISYCGAGERCTDSPAPEEVERRTIDLPGTVSDLVFSPAGGDLWVVYRDLAYASVVSFDATPDGFDTPCLSGTDSKPCVVAHVSLTFECRDGLDNDGDGLVDAADPQCYGPRGAESPLGIGRLETGTCANGIDDDGDGLIDRDDPNCALASGAEDVAAFDEPPQTVCSDGIDNDGDGSVDYPNDTGCYGALGRSERFVPHTGFDAVGIDPHGVFVYVADRVEEQILVVDARRKRLIDGPASELPRADAFDAELGVDLAPSPLAVQGAIDRQLVWVDPDDADHVIVRYDFGAWVSANNGSIQYIDTVVSFCEFTGEVVDNPAFWRGEQSEAESNCLSLPRFPLDTATSRVLAADSTLPAGCLEPDFVECVSCVEAGELPCAACLPYADTQFELCQRAFVDQVTQYVNPRFALRDGGGDDGRLLGLGTCEQPDELLESMQEAAQENPSGPQGLKCDSLLMPQPLQPSALSLEPTDVSGLSALGRADLFELRTLQFDTTAGNEPIVGFRPFDQRILTEGITTTFEGIIPGTQRSDGLFAANAEEDGSIWVDVGFNPCTQGVAPGDRFIVTGEPRSRCAVTDDLEYEIVETTHSEVRIAPVDGLAAAVPVRNCFETGFAYEVRASDEWIVVGEGAGFLSPYEAAFGQCVPRYSSSDVTSRVRTGELYQGPYYSFYMYPGFAGDDVQPVRGTSTTFRVSSGFSSVSFPTCSSLGQRCAAGLFPVDVLWVPGLPAGTLLLSPDPNDEFVHVRNLSDAAAGYTVVR